MDHRNRDPARNSQSGRREPDPSRSRRRTDLDPGRSVRGVLEPRPGERACVIRSCTAPSVLETFRLLPVRLRAGKRSDIPLHWFQPKISPRLEVHADPPPPGRGLTESLSRRVVALSVTPRCSSGRQVSRRENQRSEDQSRGRLFMRGPSLKIGAFFRKAAACSPEQFLLWTSFSCGSPIVTFQTSIASFKCSRIDLRKPASAWASL